MPESSRRRTATLSLPAVAFGTNFYIDILIAVQLVIWLLFIEEVVRTHFWRALNSFDFINPTKLVLGASGAGTGLALAAKRQASHSGSQNQRSDELDADKLRIRLDYSVDSDVATPVLALDGPKAVNGLGSRRPTSTSQIQNHGTTIADDEHHHPPPTIQTGPNPAVTIPMQRMNTGTLSALATSPLRPNYQRLDSEVEEHGHSPGP